MDIKKDGAKISRGAKLKEYLFLGWEDLSMFLGWREGTNRGREDKNERKMYYHTHVIGETSEGRIKIISRTQTLIARSFSANKLRLEVWC